MSPEEAVKFIKSKIVVTREDVARAKASISKRSSGRSENLARVWLEEQGVKEQHRLQTNNQEELLALAKAYGLRKSFYQAVFELAATGDLVLTENATTFSVNLACVAGNTHWESQKFDMGFPEPHAFLMLTLPGDLKFDPDIFLQGIDCSTLHSGIREAIEQSLDCFRRGLYMPATAMLAAGAEATWTECGIQVAKHLANVKLDGIVNDSYASISRKVNELRKALEAPAAKPLLKSADQTIAKVIDAEVWTTVLRDRRNALHWGKAQSFIADHSETATLLMAAPLHIGTLEAIRARC